MHLGFSRSAVAISSNLEIWLSEVPQSVLTKFPDGPVQL